MENTTSSTTARPTRTTTASSAGDDEHLGSGDTTGNSPIAVTD